VNSNSIDREQWFQTTVNRDSDVVVNTSSSPIGIGVSRSWTCVDDIVKSGLCVSAEPRHSASTGRRNSILWIEVVGGTLDPKNWTKDCGGGGAGARLPGNPLLGRAHWSGLRRKKELPLRPCRSGSLRQFSQNSRNSLLWLPGRYTPDKRANEWKNFWRNDDQNLHWRRSKFKHHNGGLP
jgi:hypothetical protein